MFKIIKFDIEMDSRVFLPHMYHSLIEDAKLFQHKQTLKYKFDLFEKLWGQHGREITYYANNPEKALEIDQIIENIHQIIDDP